MNFNSTPFLRSTWLVLSLIVLTTRAIEPASDSTTNNPPATDTVSKDYSLLSQTRSLPELIVPQLSNGSMMGFSETNATSAAPEVKEVVLAAADDATTTDTAVKNITEQLTTATKVATGKTLNASVDVVYKLSDQIRMILKHFQNPEAVPLPGDKIIPDPMDVPDLSGSLGVANGNFTNITVHDQSKFTIESMNTNLDDMQIYVSLRMKRLMILGNYTVSGLLIDTTGGPFNVTLTDVLAEGTVYLAKDEDGRIYANRSVTNMNQQNINAEFVNTSSFLVNVAATFLFIGIKPYVLNKVDEKLCSDLNARLGSVAFRLPKEPWSPVDLAVIEARKYVKSRHYDPLVIKNALSRDDKFFAVRIDKITLNGLSRFTRVGNVTLLMENNTIQFGIRMMTGKIEGTVEWFYDFGKIGINRNGSSTFSINRIQVYALVNQSVDIRNRPVLQSLDIETGQISVKMDGEGSFDYVVEFVVMLLPKIVRHMIIDSLEVPIRYQVQKILDNIDVEKLVDDHVDSVDDYLKNFKLNYD